VFTSSVTLGRSASALMDIQLSSILSSFSSAFAALPAVGVCIRKTSTFVWQDQGRMETQSRGVPGSYLPATAVPALAPPCRGLQAHSVAFGYTAPTAPIACDCDALHKVMPCCIKLSQGGWSHAATAATAEHTRCGWTLEVVSWHGCASLDILGLAAVGWMPNVRINSYACIPSHCIQTNAHSCVATRNASERFRAEVVCFGGLSQSAVEPCGELEWMDLPTLHCNAERFHHLHQKHNRRGSAVVPNGAVLIVARSRLSCCNDCNRTRRGAASMPHCTATSTCGSTPNRRSAVLTTFATLRVFPPCGQRSSEYRTGLLWTLYTAQCG
jgi:hypothetical protein